MSLNQIITCADFLEMARLRFNVENSLPDNLFDSHFLNCSPIARNVRKKFLEAGFEFKLLSSRTEINQFNMTGFFTLPLMYKRHAIFYHQNLEALELLIQEYPHFAKHPLNMIVPRIEHSGNKIMHESIHFLNFKEYFGISYYDFSKDFTYLETVRWLLTHLSIESSVLAAEIMATLVSQSTVNDYARYVSCHQVAQYPDDYKLFLVDCFQALGLEQTYLLLCYSYMAANMFPDEKGLSEKNENLLIEKFGHADLVRQVLKRTMKLTVSFTGAANRMYFFSLGHEGDYFELLKSIEWETVIKYPKVKEIFEFNFKNIIETEIK